MIFARLHKFIGVFYLLLIFMGNTIMGFFRTFGAKNRS